MKENSVTVPVSDPQLHQSHIFPLSAWQEPGSKGNCSCIYFFLRGHSWLVCLPPCLNSLCIACSIRQISFIVQLPLLIVLSEFGILTLDYWSWHHWLRNSIGNCPGNYPLGFIYHSLMPTSSPGTRVSTLPLRPPYVQGRSLWSKSNEKHTCKQRRDGYIWLNRCKTCILQDNIEFYDSIYTYVHANIQWLIFKLLTFLST